MLKNTKLTSGYIAQLKEKYGSLYVLNIGDNIYLYRPLTKEEFLLLLSLKDIFGMDDEDIILDKCLLYPEKGELDNILAGEVSYVIESIVKTSGFADADNIEHDIDKARNQVGILDNQIVMFICKAFPQLTPKDIGKFTYEQMLYHLALSEQIIDATLKIEKGGSPIDFNNHKPGNIQSNIPFHHQKPKRTNP